ncbi:hypothetical protein EDD17DRAFT_1511402 [Pisolithus thermaeus]|nr:hypothetical protein EDD17DRAFT_1511402 [Pisolithus thermaeus]
MYYCVSFHEAVGNVLVANDLDQASRIAFGDTKRWRVGTLAGQLIGAPGTMSGGGNLVARGGMSSKLAPEAVRSEELRAKEQESAVEEWLTHAGPRLDRDSEELSRTAASMSKRRSNHAGEGNQLGDQRVLPPPKKSQQRSSSAELHIYGEDELGQFRRRDLAADPEYLDEKIKNAKPDPGVLKDYKKRDEEFTRRTKDLEQLTD